jgi:hypothetical protein
LIVVFFISSVLPQSGLLKVALKKFFFFLKKKVACLLSSKIVTSTFACDGSHVQSFGAFPILSRNDL